MPSETIDRLRVPLAVGLGVLLLLSVYLFVRRTDTPPVAVEPSASIVVGEPGGGLLTPEPTPSPSAAAPTATPVVTPAATPTPTPAAPPSDVGAEVMACREISGDRCVDEVRQLRPGDDSVVALVLFENARVGDVVNVVLAGPGGTIEGGEYTLTGSGRGYYYSTLPVGGLPPGEYTLTATWNGAEVDETELRKGDGGDGDDDDD